MKKQIMIIGGGSTGLSTALELAKLDGKIYEIVVVEKNFVGSGQTGHCCGFVRNFYNKKEMIFSAHESMKAIKKICAQSKELEYEKKGLLVIDSIQNKSTMKENAKLLRSMNVAVKYLEKDAIRSVHSFVDVKDSCAVLDEDAGYVNPKLIIDYLKNECLQHGVKILEHTAVTKITQEKNGFYVETSKNNVTVDKIFNATAAYTNKINQMLGFELPIKVIKINNCFYRLPTGPNKYLVAIADFKNLFYSIPHKEFVDVSSIVLDLKNAINPGTSGEFNHDTQTISDYLQDLAKRIGNAESATSLGGFGSCIDVSPDYYPILSSIDEISNYYCATGFSGTGFKHFPMIGKVMAEIILEKKYTYPELVKFFRYDRFKKEELRRGVSDSYFIKE